MSSSFSFRGVAAPACGTPGGGARGAERRPARPTRWCLSHRQRLALQLLVLLLVQDSLLPELIQLRELVGGRDTGDRTLGGLGPRHHLDIRGRDLWPRDDVTEGAYEGQDDHEQDPPCLPHPAQV